MSFELSCTDVSFLKLSHETALRVVADLGIPAVDLCVFAGYPFITPGEVAADPTGTADAAAALVGRAGLRVADVFAQLDTGLDELAVNHPDPAQRDESRRLFKAILEFTIRLGAPGITVLPGIPWEGEAEEASLMRAAEELSWRVDRGAEAGIEVSVEPHYLSIVPTVETTMKLLQATPGLTLTLDHAHFIFQGIPETDVDVLFPFTRHVQARQAAPGMMQAVAREGTIDFPRIIRAFGSAGYDGCFSIEYVWDAWLDLDKVDCLSETAQLRDVFLETRVSASQ